ncbi:MAG TPA: DedA family protein [Candidatus Paceibacterota bacterium]|nr:DedA family protein [Candidatus Paceibacterota bacterium]HMP19110.1 DedA family protein [Candidatus Paceibacterota bacterium]HMP85114.1 DedA family protein [Candidatus Paceibacterota bacterium]
MNLSTEIFNLIQNYGYFFVFIGGLLEGESILILSGFLAQQEHLKLPLILIFALLGALISDYIWFFAGRYYGNKIMQKYAIIKKISNQSLSSIDKNSKIISFGLRFMYGFRSIIPFTLGLSKIKAIHFLFLNFLGGIFWVLIFSKLGYMLGDITENLFGQIKKYNLAIIIFVILIFIFINFAIKIIKYFVKKKINIVSGDDVNV